MDSIALATMLNNNIIQVMNVCWLLHWNVDVLVFLQAGHLSALAPAADDNASTLPIRGKVDDQSSRSSPGSGVVLRESRGRTNSEFVSFVHLSLL